MIKGILQSVYNGSAQRHKARFSELAFATPEMRNRKKLGEYLKLLVNELGWLEKREELKTSPYVPRRTRPDRKWVESWYYLTDKGRTFISLFPPQEEEEENNKKERGPKRAGLFAIKAILENAEGGVFSFSTLASTTNGASNRKNLLAYLTLLCDELGWLKRKKGVWTKLQLYDITEKGRSFLDLFHKDSEKEENA